MGHLLNTLILSINNQKESNAKKTDNDSLLVIAQGHLGIRCRVQAQYIWKLNRILKVCVHVLDIVHMFRDTSELSASRRPWQRPKIIPFCILGSFALKIKSSQW